ncbi:RagB/SusD family nutrient uptake outer membrane protein [Bacteroidota bacterium]
MKKLYKYTFAIFILLVSGCSDVLDIETDGTISGDVLTNDDTIEKSLIGAYYSLGGITDGIDGGELLGGDFIVIPTLMARAQGIEIFWSSVQAPGYANFIDKDIITTNIRVVDNWKRAYEVINTVNNILLNIGNVSATNKDRVQGEALAIRGILYFEMVRLWAPQYDADGVNPASDLAIPVLTEPIVAVDQIETPTLSTIDEVYNRAEADLSSASALLMPLGKNGTRLNYYACQAYLARLSLQKGEFANARTYADNVIASGEYTLTSTPLTAFNNTSNSPEDIFAVQQTLANNTGDRSSGSGITTFYSSLLESGLGILGILKFSLNSSFLINSPKFSAGDLRGTVDLLADSSTSSNQINTAFYRNVYNTALISSAKYIRADNVLPIIRLSEMYLTRAEATFESLGSAVTQEAVDDLNVIRSRAGISTVSVSDFATPEAFFDSLALERTRELLYEGQLLHDLKRWGGYIGSNFDPKDPWDPEYVLPIPQSEQDTW